MNVPWSSKNKRYADQVASECDGMAATFEDAFRMLSKENPLFEKELYDKIAQSANIVRGKVRNRTSLPGTPSSFTLPNDKP